MFQIEFSNQSKKFLKNCDNVLNKRIFKKVELLQLDPVPHDAKCVIVRRAHLGFGLEIIEYFTKYFGKRKLFLLQK